MADERVEPNIRPPLFVSSEPGRVAVINSAREIRPRAGNSCGYLAGLAAGSRIRLVKAFSSDQTQGNSPIS